jgi:VCBS repeat-containing protein
LAAALLLSACGGGGGAGDGNNAQAAITGTTNGAIASGSTEAAGTISVTDTDAGQATFAQPSSLTGVYGTWSFVVTGATAAWRYMLTTTPSVATTETLSVKSKDGSATQIITVSISASSGSSSSSALVTTVAAPVYSGTYAAEKVAVFNRLNDDRSRCGFGKLAQNSKLDLAAQNHADYIRTNKDYSHSENPNLSGYTGQTLDSRLGHVGYPYSSGGEVIGVSNWGTWAGGSDYSAVEVSANNQLLNLFATVYHLQGLMSKATEIGLGVANFQWNNDSTWNGKITVANYAVPINGAGQKIATDALATFPCNEVSGLVPAFKSEIPDPFPSGGNRDLNPYGHPIYLATGPDTSLTLSAGTITKRGGAAVPTTTLTASNDPNQRLLANEVFLVPTARLADNSTYDVMLSGTSSGMISSANPTGAWSRSFSFTTGSVLSE